MFKYLETISLILLVVGGLNWGLFAFFDFNLVSFVFKNAMMEKAIYGLVSLAAIYQIINWRTIYKHCCEAE